MTVPLLADLSSRQFADLTVVSFMVGLIIGSIIGHFVFGI